MHFVEWLEENGVTGRTIYHMGSGGHHYVGVRCAEPELDNRVMSITASTPEYEAFIKLAKEQPALLHHYTCYFGDIYTSHADLLPPFDVVTLFHACEFRNEKNDAYGALTDLEVMELFVDKLSPAGTSCSTPAPSPTSRRSRSWRSSRKAGRWRISASSRRCRSIVRSPELLDGTNAST